MIALRPLHWLGMAAAASAVVVATWLLYHFDPNSANSPFPGCMFRELTGFLCIGCGMTRAMHALVHGDLLRALHMNPLGVLLLPAVPLMVAHSRGWRPTVLEPVMRWLLEPRLWLVLLPAYWVARNLPWFPFTLMAPL